MGKSEETNETQDNKRRKGNSDFVMFSRNTMDNVSELGCENPNAFRVFMFISKHMDGTNALVVSMTAMTEILGLSRQTLSKAIKYLKDNGWLCVLKSGTSNVYIINPNVVWTAYADQKVYCKFQSNVFLSGTENAEYLQSREASTHYKTISDDFIKANKENRKMLSDLRESVN